MVRLFSMQRPGLNSIASSEQSRSALLLGLSLIILQILDGLFTAIGVNRYGVAVEGNPIIRTLMDQFGAFPALAIIKIVAVLLVIFVTLQATKISWVRNVLGAASFTYLVAAVLPWGILLFS